MLAARPRTEITHAIKLAAGTADHFDAVRRLFPTRRCAYHDLGLLPTLATTIQILQVLRARGPARRISETSKTCATVEIGRLHFEADRSLGRQLVVCVVRSLRARGDGSPTAWQHYMLIVVDVVQGRPRRRLGDDTCVGLGYAVAALVNYGIGAARRAAFAGAGGGPPKDTAPRRHSRINLTARQSTPAINAAIYRPIGTLYQLQPSFHTHSTEPEPTARAPRPGEEFY